MGTYSSIQTRVNRRVIDLPSQVTAEVPTLVNEAIKDLQRSHTFKVMEKELAAVTTVGVRTLIAVPADFKDHHGEPWFQRFTDASIRFMTISPNREAVWGLVDQDDTGYPITIVDGQSPADDGSRSFEVYPLPDGLSDYSDGEYRLTIPYHRYLPDLVNSGDSNWFTVNAERFIVEWATAEAFGLDWDMEHEQLHRAKAEVERTRIVKTDKLYRLSSVRELVPHWRGVHSTKTRV